MKSKLSVTMGPQPQPNIQKKSSFLDPIYNNPGKVAAAAASVFTAIGVAFAYRQGYLAAAVNPTTYPTICEYSGQVGSWLNPDCATHQYTLVVDKLIKQAQELADECKVEQGRLENECEKLKEPAGSIDAFWKVIGLKGDTTDKLQKACGDIEQTVKNLQKNGGILHPKLVEAEKTTKLAAQTQALNNLLANSLFQAPKVDVPDVKAAIKAAKQKVETAEKDLADATEKLNAAQTNLTAATSEETKKTVQEAVTKAQEAVKKAQDYKTAAQNELNKLNV